MNPIATLGRLDVLQASGQLDRLMRSGLRYCEQIRIIDAHAAGETKPVSALRSDSRIASRSCAFFYSSRTKSKRFQGIRISGIAQHFIFCNADIK